MYPGAPMGPGGAASPWGPSIAGGADKTEGPKTRGFLITLEQSGILTPQNRELVIERSLAASGASLTIEQLKLIVLMVLWNQQTPTSQLVAEELFSGPQDRLPN